MIEPKKTITYFVLLHNAKADEWENITGASLASIVSLDVFRELCDRSIIMPSRFNSFITVCEKKIFIGCNLMLGLFHCSNSFMFFGYLNYCNGTCKEKMFLMILLSISAIIIYNITLILNCLLIFKDRRKRPLHVL